jgi:hypothetical protein
VGNSVVGYLLRPVHTILLRILLPEIDPPKTGGDLRPTGNNMRVDCFKQLEKKRKKEM